MFTVLWRKYLPIIKILMKRTGEEPQALGLNRIDFERAAGGRKIKATFRITVENGRLRPGSQPSQLAKDLVELLQGDDTTRALLAQQQYEFSLSTSFQFTVKKNSPSELNVSEKSATNDEH